MYKQDLALNHYQQLISLKTQPTDVTYPYMNMYGYVKRTKNVHNIYT